MMINGHNYSWDEAVRRVQELKNAIERLPFNAPLRLHFEFLIGFVEALDAESDDSNNALYKLGEAQETINDCLSGANKALEGLGQAPQGELDDAIVRLVELAQTNVSGLKELTAVIP